MTHTAGRWGALAACQDGAESAPWGRRAPSVQDQRGLSWNHPHGRRPPAGACTLQPPAHVVPWGIAQLSFPPPRQPVSREAEPLP